jgi:hypothetical protein
MCCAPSLAAAGVLRVQVGACHVGVTTPGTHVDT